MPGSFAHDKLINDRLSAAGFGHDFWLSGSLAAHIEKRCIIG